MKKAEIIRFLIIRTIGNFLILFMIFGFVATFGPALYYEVTYRIDEMQGVRFAVANVTETDIPPSELGVLLRKLNDRPQDLTEEEASRLGVILKESKEKILIPQSIDFSIVIPKIGANSKVIANIDPANEKEYLDALVRGVAHAKGTAFPGMNGNIYLFAHSADSWWNVGRYNAIFYLLKELKPGEEIAVFFLGKRHNYIVEKSEIVDPSEVQYLKADIGSGERLILQTCWPPGTTWKRQLVFAKPK